jgi:hypothetical protein
LELHPASGGLEFPNGQNSKKVLKLLHRNRYDIVVQVKVDSQSNKLSRGREEMTRSNTRFNAQKLKKVQEHVPKELGQVLWTDGDEVIDVIQHSVVTAGAWHRTGTGASRVDQARGRRKLRPEEPTYGIRKVLVGHHGTTVGKGKHPVEV